MLINVKLTPKKGDMKAFGTYECEVKLYSGITATVKAVVTKKNNMILYLMAFCHQVFPVIRIGTIKEVYVWQVKTER